MYIFWSCLSRHIMNSTFSWCKSSRDPFQNLQCFIHMQSQPERGRTTPRVWRLQLSIGLHLRDNLWLPTFRIMWNLGVVSTTSVQVCSFVLQVSIGIMSSTYLLSYQLGCCSLKNAMLRTKVKLMNGQIQVAGDQWLVFLYADYMYDPEDPWNGLLHSGLLVSVSFFILILMTSLWLVI